MVVASCRNKYYGTNFISAVPTSLLIAPGLWTIQFLFNTFFVRSFVCFAFCVHLHVFYIFCAFFVRFCVFLFVFVNSDEFEVDVPEITLLRIVIFSGRSSDPYLYLIHICLLCKIHCLQSRKESFLLSSAYSKIYKQVGASTVLFGRHFSAHWRVCLCKNLWSQGLQSKRKPA
jgi:hypothetical protein